MKTNNVDFYLLETSSLEESSSIICRQLEQLYQKGDKIYVNAPTQQVAQWLDDQLWTFRDISFVPHGLIDNEQFVSAPLHIGWGAKPVGNYEVLFNLAEAVPDYFANFSRIIEIIFNDEALKTSGREKYKFYRSNHCQLSTHKNI